MTGSERTMPLLEQMMNLRGRTALITGGCGHLGRAFAETLAEMGASIALVDLSEDRLASTAAAISDQYGVAVHAFAADLSDNTVVAELPGRVAGTTGGVDILVNNAAFVGTSSLTGWCVPFEQQSHATWRAALEVNLTAPFFLVQAALPWLAGSGKGVVINIASLYGHLGPDMRLYEGTSMGNPAAYAASKGGLIQATRWLSTVLAPRVRVNCISPGGVWRNQPPEFVERYCSRTPLGRMATEDDFKGAVAYLASDLSLYVTGQHIAVDGGFGVW